MKYPAIVLAVLLAVPASAGDKLIWTTILAPPAAADCLTTESAIARGGMEWNPLLRQVGLSGRAAIKLATNVGIITFADWLKSKGHRKTAWSFVIGFAVLQGVWAINNYRYGPR